MDHKEYRLAAIMYTDIVGFSRMMEQNEAATLRLLEYHNQLVTELAADHGGKVIKTAGDAFLVDFSSALQAVKCSAAIQRAIAQHTADEDSGEMRLQLRIGVHVGDIYFLENDALGDGINIASRLQSIAKPGTICISQDVYNLIQAKLDERIRPRGTVHLKNITREVAVYEIEPGAGNAGDQDDVSAHASAEIRKENQREALKARILQEIKRVGRRISVAEARDLLGDAPERDALIGALADRGLLSTDRSAPPAAPPSTARTGAGAVRPMFIPSHRGSSLDDDDDGSAAEAEWDRALSREDGLPPETDPLIVEYREQTEEASEKNQGSFRTHLGSFLGVNAGLVGIWAFTSGFGTFPWFLIPLSAWGIGIVSHWGGVRRQNREVREMRNMRRLTRKQLRTYRKLVKARNGWGGHFLSTTMVSVMLMVIWGTTGGAGAFFWPIFPIGAMAIGLLAHYPAFKANERRIARQLQSEGIELSTAPAPPQISGPSLDAPLAVQAEQIRSGILEMVRRFGKQSPLGDDFEPMLDNYVNQIRELSRRDSEIDQIIQSIPVGELDRDLLQLERKAEDASTQAMREEYEHSAQQIRRQQRSVQDLRQQRERLSLRLGSALNSLKQLQLDLARMQTAAPDEDDTATRLLRDKSDELTQYLEDLREGYREIEQV